MDKIVLTIAGLTVHAVWTEQANWRLHRQNKKLKQQVAAQAECIERTATLCGYFAAKLDESGIELDEFDLIAINSM